jgi:hypothetical protein
MNYANLILTLQFLLYNLQNISTKKALKLVFIYLQFVFKKLIICVNV